MNRDQRLVVTIAVLASFVSFLDGTVVNVALPAIAKELGISATSLANWNRQASIDAGEKPGIATDDRAEVARLRRDNRRLELENEILKKAAAYFARENVLPKGLTD